PQYFHRSMTILHNTLINREVSGSFGGQKIDCTNVRGRLAGRDRSVWKDEERTRPLGRGIVLAATCLVSCYRCRAPQECAGTRCLNSAAWSFTKSCMFVGASPVSLRMVSVMRS